MDFLTLAKQRCSTRSFKKRSVSNELIDKIIESAHVAPTNGNIQNFHVYVIDDEITLSHLSQYAQIYNAPLVFVVTYNKAKVFKPSVNTNDSGLIDTCVILSHMMLEATDLELGSVWINYFKQEPISVLLNCDKNESIAHLLAVGHPNVPFKDVNRHERERKPLSELVTFVRGE